MSQRNDNRTLYWEDEPRASKRPAAIAVKSDNFWRSVWKGIENSKPAHTLETGHRDLALEPPRDYVVDSSQRLYR